MSLATTRRILVFALLLLALGLVWQESPRRPGASSSSVLPSASAKTHSSGGAPAAAVASPAVATIPPAPNRVSIAAPAEAFAAFDAWFLALRRGENPAPALGAELARVRRAALKDLIATDPRAALARAVPRALRAELPLEVQAELETAIDAFGHFEVAISCFGAAEKTIRTAEVDGRHYSAHVFGRRAATLSKTRLPIHGIALDDQLAIDDAAFRFLEAGESGVDSPAAEGIRVAVGSERQIFATAREFELWRNRAANAEIAPDPNAILSGPETAAATANWTFGEKSVLFVRVEFPDDPGLPATDAEIVASMAEVDQLYREASRGRCSMRPVILPGALRLTRAKASFVNNTATYIQMRDEAVALARAYDGANGNAGIYNPDRADRHVIVCKNVSSFGFSGIAGVGTNWSLLNGTVASWVAAHELGHDHGVFHANAWVPTGPTAIGLGTPQFYGDIFDIMGNTARLPGAHFNAKHKETLLYLEGDQIANASTDGIYRLYRHDHRDAAGVQALKINSGDYELWLEHRQQVPRPDFPETDRMRAGLQFRWGRYPASVGITGTFLLDMTPGSARARDDAPLIRGETFVDPNAGLNITPIAVGGASPREWIDVRLAYGSTGGGNRNPVLAANAPMPWSRHEPT